MRVGIVGLPYSGKTALYCAVSGADRERLNLMEENLAAVRIPDPRLDYLEDLFSARKRTEASIDFVDLPGSTDGEIEKAGLTKHLPSLRQADVLAVIVRAFDNDSVPLPPGGLDPQRDLSNLRDEMLFADLEICANRVERLEKAVKRPTKDRELQQKELELLQRCQQALENEEALSTVIQPGEEEKLVRSFGFLTQKPLVIVVNVSEEAVGSDTPLKSDDAATVIAIAAELEAEIMQVDEADRDEFMGGYGITELARDRLIRACFDALGMICFLTAGEEEVRAWPIPKGFNAQEAAGKIHSDLARGFIRAETIAYQDLVDAGSVRDAKAANKYRQEPRNYIVLDGDILNIKFNV